MVDQNERRKFIEGWGVILLGAGMAGGFALLIAYLSHFGRLGITALGIGLAVLAVAAGAKLMREAGH